MNNSILTHCTGPLRLDLLQSVRSLRHHAWQTILSVLGIAVGTACLALTTNWLWTENNYDSFRDGYRDMYAIQADSTSFGPSTTLPYAMRPQLDSLLGDRIPHALTRYAKPYIGASEDKESMFEKTLIEATPGIGDALNIKVLRGSLESTLTSEGSIAITEHIATLLFGEEDALDKTVYVCGWWGEPQPFVVGAVIESCGKSNSYYDAIYRLAEEEWFMNWGSSNFKIVVRTDNTDATLSLLNQIEQPERYRTTYSLIPMRTVHLQVKSDDEYDYIDQNFYPLMFCFIAGLLLLSAIVNLVTIFTSIFLGRTREYALRRSLGAKRWQNVRWICTSSMPVVLAGIVLGLAALAIVLRFNPVLGGNASHYCFFGLVSIVTFVACMLGMAYPVWKLERSYRLSLGYGIAGRENSHAWLLLVQSFVCALLLFISIGMQRQLYSMMNDDMGFSRDNLLRLHTGWGWHPSWWERDIQTNDLKMQPDYSYRDIFWDLPSEIKAESAAVDDAIAMPFDIFNRNTGIGVALMAGEHITSEQERELWEKSNGDEADREEFNRQMVKYIELPYAAFDFFNIEIDGNPLRQQDEQEGTLNVLMNDKARARFQIRENGLSDWHTSTLMQMMNSNTDSSKGKHMCKQRLNVTGTINIDLDDFHNETEPLIITGIPERHDCLFSCRDAVYVRYAPGKQAEAEAAIRRVLARHDVPETSVIIETIEDYIACSYREEIFYAQLITAIGVLSVIITLSGVLSLLLYALRMRRRSIAIRRLHGAGFRDLFRSYLVPFVGYTTVGAIPAFVPAWLFMRRWMEYFHHGTAPGIGLAAVILAAMLALVVIIVYVQVKMAMKARPVEVLKPEA